MYVRFSINDVDVGALYPIHPKQLTDAYDSVINIGYSFLLSNSSMIRSPFKYFKIYCYITHINLHHTHFPHVV